MRYNWYYINSFLNKKEVAQINKICEVNGILQMQSADTTKTSEAKGVHYSHMLPFIDKMEDVTNMINTQYYGFNLFPSTRDGKVSYNIYKGKNKGEYKWHHDAENMGTAFELKLTAIVNLSEKPFVGGEFFLWKNKEAEISQLIVPGTLLVFPSFYIHKVNPVIKGTRKTLTFWRCGKPWT